MSTATAGYGSTLAHSTDGTSYTDIAQTVDLSGPEPVEAVIYAAMAPVVARALGEHPYAWMKRLMNFTRCRYRGLRRNTFDFVMTAAAYNLRRAASLLAGKASPAAPAR